MSIYWYCQEKLDVDHVQELKGLLFICSGGTGLLSCFMEQDCMMKELISGKSRFLIEMENRAKLLHDNVNLVFALALL